MSTSSDQHAAFPIAQCDGPRHVSTDVVTSYHVVLCRSDCDTGSAVPRNHVSFCRVGLTVAVGADTVRMGLIQEQAGHVSDGERTRRIGSHIVPGQHVVVRIKEGDACLDVAGNDVALNIIAHAVAIGPNAVRSRLPHEANSIQIAQRTGSRCINANVVTGYNILRRCLSENEHAPRVVSGN